MHKMGIAKKKGTPMLQERFYMGPNRYKGHSKLHKKTKYMDKCLPRLQEMSSMSPNKEHGPGEARDISR